MLTLRRIVLAIGAAVTLGLAAGFVAFANMIEHVERPPSHHADGIVVLTGGADRVNDAMTLLLAGHADRLLITGVNPTTRRKDLAHEMPAARAAVECCVDLGYRAENTLGNAEETAEWVRARAIKSIIVVTSNYHMPRALAEMAYSLPGVELQAYPVVAEHARPDARWDDVPQWLRLVLGEYVKYVVTCTRQALFPPQGGTRDLRLATDTG